jgi:polyhydroxybutyrate depolymerase
MKTPRLSTRVSSVNRRTRPCTAPRSISLLSLSLLALSGCSGGDEEDPSSSLPLFQQPTNNGAPSATVTAPGAAPPAPSATGGDMTPVTGLMQPPPAATATGNGSSVTPPAPTTAPTTPVPPVVPPPATGGASAGCGRTQGVPANYAVANTIVTFPPGYDGSTPVPLLFAFHGAGRTNTDMRNVDSRTPGSMLENTYVMAFMKSAGNAWDVGTDYPRFEAALDQMLGELCVDTTHLFAMGHSSGAQFIVGMLGDSRARETRFAAVAPVSSSLLNNPPWNPLPTLLIHGLNDTQRPNDPNGAQDISQYAGANQCSGGTTALNIGTCNSIAPGNAAVNPGCVTYNGCAATTLFCNHNDPNYIDNGTPSNHGWPCFANQELFDFFQATRQ